MPVSRTVAWEVEANRGHNVWEILCRTALRGADLAARVLGLEDSENRVERADSLVGHGMTLPSFSRAARPIDWAKLGEFERGRVTRATQGRV